MIQKVLRCTLGIFSGNIYFDIANKPDRRVWLVCFFCERGCCGRRHLPRQLSSCKKEVQRNPQIFLNLKITNIFPLNIFGLRHPASASCLGAALASCRPRPQQLLPVSATGRGRRRCKANAAAIFNQLIRGQGTAAGPTPRTAGSASGPPPVRRSSLCSCAHGRAAGCGCS